MAIVIGPPGNKSPSKNLAVVSWSQLSHHIKMHEQDLYDLVRAFSLYGGLLRLRVADEIDIREGVCDGCKDG